MDVIQIILCIVSAFFLGAAICFFVIWLIFMGIPYFKGKKWKKFEDDVVYIVKKNFDRPMTINKEFIKGIVEEVLNDKH